MYLDSTSCGEIGLILHQILLKVLGYKTNGTFVEVGANDGKTGSFTFNLGKIGWHGLNCEPIPRLFELCKKNHEQHMNVKTIQIAAGEKKDILEIVDADTLSTMDSDTLKLYLKTDWAINNFKNARRHKVDVDSLDAILMYNNIKENFDLLVLDVEGFEENVLKGFTITRYHPKMIIIEIADQHPSFIHSEPLMNKFKRLRDYFKNNGYSLLVNDVVDNVYVRNDMYNSFERDYFSQFIKFSQFKVEYSA
jgi:FkbM family methyltransferase